MMPLDNKCDMAVNNNDVPISTCSGLAAIFSGNFQAICRRISETVPDKTLIMTTI